MDGRQGQGRTRWGSADPGAEFRQQLLTISRRIRHFCTLPVTIIGKPSMNLTADSVDSRHVRRAPADRAQRRRGLLTVIDLQTAKGDPAKAVRLLQDRREDGFQVAGRAVDDPQYLGGRGLSGQRLVPLGVGCGTLASKIGDDLPGSTNVLSGSGLTRGPSETVFPAAHTVIGTGSTLISTAGVGPCSRWQAVAFATD